jgi:hypothetical protein
MPSLDFSIECLNKRQGMAVFKVGETMGSNHLINFFLRFFLSIRVQNHGQDSNCDDACRLHKYQLSLHTEDSSAQIDLLYLPHLIGTFVMSHCDHGAGLLLLASICYARDMFYKTLVGIILTLHQFRRDAWCSDPNCLKMLSNGVAMTTQRTRTMFFFTNSKGLSTISFVSFLQ